MTREGDPQPFIKAMEDIQKWTAAFDYGSLDDTIKALQACNAFEKSLVDFHLLQSR